MSPTSKTRSAAGTLAFGAVLFSTSMAAAQAAPLPLAPAPYRNNAMRVAGIVITSVASGVLVAGAGVLVWGAQLSRNGGDEAGFGQGLVATVVMPMSAVLAAVGVPLWVVGAKPPEKPAGSSAWAVPAVAPGPRSIGLRWTF